jgi:Uma2 family endonuclease
MARHRPLHRYTYADYVGVELASPTKHEFLDGEIYAMAGGSEDQSALAAEVLAVLTVALASKPCRTHPVATALNPTVLLEVTSDSSEEYDTGTKLDAYATIRSLRDYIIVSHRERRITVHHPADDETWSARVAISGGRVAIASIDAELDVDAIYRKSGVSRD